MVSRSEILIQLNKLNIRDLTKNYWYFYSIMINGLAVAKPGSSTVDLLNRIHNYINVEHSNQTISNFKLIAVVEFRNIKSVKNIENFIKANIDEKLHIFSNQPPLLEQYQLKSFYDITKKYLDRFPFALNSYINPNANNDIDELIKLQTTKYLTSKYESNVVESQIKPPIKPEINHPINHPINRQIRVETKIPNTSNTSNTSNVSNSIWIEGYYRSGCHVNGYHRKDGTYVRGHERAGCYVEGHFRCK